jgi:hypothetical protein
VLHLPSPDRLFEYLERSMRRLTTSDPSDFGPVGSRGRALAWNWSFWGRALVFAYRATGEVRFLELFGETVAEILDQNDARLDLADDAKGRVVHGINQYVTSARTSLLGDRFAGLSLAGAGLALWFLVPRGSTSRELRRSSTRARPPA